MRRCLACGLFVLTGWACQAKFGLEEKRGDAALLDVGVYAYLSDPSDAAGISKVLHDCAGACWWAQGPPLRGEVLPEALRALASQARRDVRETGVRRFIWLLPGIDAAALSASRALVADCEAAGIAQIRVTTRDQDWRATLSKLAVQLLHGPHSAAAHMQRVDASALGPDGACRPLPLAMAPLLSGTPTAPRVTRYKFPRDTVDTAWRRRVEYLRFAEPNEGAFAELLNQAQLRGGLYVGLGADRTLFHAGRLGAEAVLQLDAEPAVLIFNALNRAWLRAAPKLRAYLDLRLQRDDMADPAAWVRRIEPYVSDPRLASERLFSWWRDVATAPARRKRWYELDRSARYGTEHYLHDPEAYKALRALAERDLHAYHLDLKDLPALRALVAQVAESEAPALSMLDISNAWMGYYEGFAGASMASWLPLFAELARDDALLVASARTQRSGGPVNWSYLALDLRDLRMSVPQEQRARCIAQLRRDLAALQSQSNAPRLLGPMSCAELTSTQVNSETPLTASEAAPR